MKKILAAAALVGLTPVLYGADLTITVDNFDTAGGTLYLSVFNSQESYDTSDSSLATLAAQGKVTDSTYAITLHNLASGVYAVRLFHDENDNGKLDSNMLGIPREGYGFSNNGGRMGPASFDDAAVTVEDDTSISISLR